MSQNGLTVKNLQHFQGHNIIGVNANRGDSILDLVILDFDFIKITWVGMKS